MLRGKRNKTNFAVGKIIQTDFLQLDPWKTNSVKKSEVDLSKKTPTETSYPQ